MKAIAFLGTITFVLAGCNAPTPSNQLVIPQISTAPYEKMNCARLAAEMDRLKASEADFSKAQERRVTGSKGHTAYYGWGTGDGMETIELVKIRAELSAITRTQTKMNCNT